MSQVAVFHSTHVEALIPSPSPVELALPIEVGTDNEPASNTTPLLKRQTRSNSQLANYVIQSIIELLTDDDLEQEGGLTGSITAKDRAASYLSRDLLARGRQGLPTAAMDI